MVPAYPDDVRETFGWFGSAVHNAQFFEGDLISLHMVLAAVDGKTTTASDLKSVESAKNKETLGRLLRNLGKRLPTSQEDIDRWDRALAVRNELIHGFFWRNHARLLTPSGCREVAAELREAALLFSTASEAVRRAIEVCIDLLGIDRLVWERQVQEALIRLSERGFA